MNLNTIISAANTVQKVGSAGLGLYNIYDQFNGIASSNLNSFEKRTKLATKAYNSELDSNDIIGDESFKVTIEEIEDKTLTPKKERFYIESYKKGYYHKEELEEIGIDCSGFDPNDSEMKKLAIGLYAGGTEIPAGKEKEFDEWKEENGFVYEKILLAKEEVKKQIEESLAKTESSNNTNYEKEKAA